MVTDRPGKSWVEPLLVTLALIAPTMIPAGGQTADTATWLASGLVQAASQFSLLVVIIGASGRLRDYGIALPRASDIVGAGGLFVVLVLLSWASKAMLALTGIDFGNATIMRPTPEGISSPMLILLSVAFTLAVGYREELLYRVYLIESLKARGAGTVTAIMVSTGLFALGHAWQGLPGILSSVVAGTAMAIAATRGFRLGALALAHAAYDLGVLLTAFGIFGGSR